MSRVQVFKSRVWISCCHVYLMSRVCSGITCATAWCCLRRSESDEWLPIDHLWKELSVARKSAWQNGQGKVLSRWPALTCSEYVKQWVHIVQNVLTYFLLFRWRCFFFRLACLLQTPVNWNDINDKIKVMLRKTDECKNEYYSQTDMESRYDLFP